MKKIFINQSIKSIWIGVFAVVLFLIFTPHAFAISSIAGAESATSSVGVALPITDFQIVGNAASTTPVKLVVSNGTLNITDTGGLGSLSGTSGSTITFTATVADANAALATLTYTRGSVGTDTLEISLVEADEVFFAGTGHLYEYIANVGDWNAANTAAGLLTRYGATGYLVTIMSQEENDFVAARLGGAGWMGASDAAVEGEWRWVTGPEAGIQFWSGDENGNTVGGNYANWSTGEPNDSGSNEDCAQFLSGGSGQWNDLPCSGSDLPGFVVEFGAPGDMPTVIAKDVSLVTVNAPTIDTFVPADNAININGSDTLTLNFSEIVTVGTGSVSIYRASDDVLVDSIDVTGSGVTGSGTDVITITPTLILDDMTEYYVQIPATAFENASNVFFLGIANTTTWSFTTGDYTEPVLSDIKAKSQRTVADIVWSSDELSSSMVIFGIKNPPTQTTFEINVAPRVTQHSVTLTGLNSCTNYYYQVVSTDDSINTNTATSAVQTFKTSGCSSGLSIPLRVAALEREGNIDDADKIRRQFPDLFTENSSRSEQIQSLQRALVALLEQFRKITGRDFTPPSIADTASDSTAPVMVDAAGLEVRDLYRGLSGEDVRALQTLLIISNAGDKSIALKNVTATGFFAGYTEDALIEYQQKYDITPAAGYFGPATRAQMKAAGLTGLWW